MNRDSEYATCDIGEHTVTFDSQKGKSDRQYCRNVMDNHESLQTTHQKRENDYASFNSIESNSQTSKSGKCKLYEGLQRKDKPNSSGTYDTLGQTKVNCSDFCGEIDVRKNRKRPCLVLFCVATVALIIGAVLSGLFVFLLMRFNQPTSKDSNNASTESKYEVNQHCVWSSWSLWTECYSPCLKGHQLRMKQEINTPGKCNSSSLVENRPCYSITCQGEEIDMMFNSSTLHSTRFLTKDKRILSNQLTSLTQIWNGFNTGFQTYSGVMADRCFEAKERIYYEVEYDFTITSQLTSTNLILEVGLAQIDQIDLNDYVGNIAKGWSFALACCGDSENVCVRAKHNGNLEINRILSQIDAQTTKRGTFGIFIDREKNQFSLITNSTNFHSVISFTGVTSNFALCPVFGVHNKEKVDVRVKLLKTQNVTNIPFNLV